MLAQLEGLLRVLGWNPRLAKIGMWALFLLALGTVLRMRVDV